MRVCVRGGGTSGGAARAGAARAGAARELQAWARGAEAAGEIHLSGEGSNVLIAGTTSSPLHYCSNPSWQ
jgi:hypothetical protein